MLRRSFAKFTNFLNSGVWSIPAADKQQKGGEDAFFYSEKVLSVADGVGGWVTSGVDPAKYAWELMRNVEAAMKSLPEDKKLHPQEVMKAAAAKSTETGSSTCCIAILDPEKPLLYTANLGDSGFYLFRKEGGESVLRYQSVSLQHSFNFPFQLGTNGDSPAQAHLEIIEIKHSDLIVMFTDGVSDNTHEEQVFSIIRPFLNLPEIPDMEIIAEMIAEKARTQSEDPNFESPFAVASRRVPGTHWDGGKPDDITVIVSQVNLQTIS